MPVLACLCVLAAATVQQDVTLPDGEATEEIVVTGERVERTLRATSSSVIVVNQAEIEASGADRVDQLLEAIPNVQLGNGSRGPAIRGLDSTGPLSALPAFLGGNRPRTTIVVDGRPATYNEFVFGTFPVWDIDRVEVFRSPQTTTQGRNSIAGAIFIETNSPTFQREYRARAIAGDFRTKELSAVISAPVIGEAVAFRVAGDVRYNRTTSRITDVMEGADPNNDVFGLLRAKLLIAPSPATRATLTYVHSQSQAPQQVGVAAPFEERRDPNPNYGIFRINVDSLTAAVRHDVNSRLTGSILLSAGDTKARRLARADFGQASNDGRDWSAEGTLHWSPDRFLRVVAGLSRTHEGLKQIINLSLLSGLTGRFRDEQGGTGLFADASFSLTPRATLTAGLRYQRDEQKRLGTITIASSSIPVDFVGNFDAWLPKATLTYEAASNLWIGALVQKAYNPGGMTFRFDTARLDEFKAETLWDYEIFARGDLAGRRASFAANLFYYDMRNAQRAQNINVFTPSGLRVGFANLFNVPKARSYGAEGQLDWRVNKQLSIGIAVGLLSTKVLKTDVESAALEGNTFDRSPHFTGSLAVDWKPIAPLRISARLRHHSSYFSDPGNSPAFRIGSARSVDLRAEYEIGQVALFGQVRNLFDTFNLRDLSSSTSGEAEPPRTFAVGLESRF